MTETFTLLLKYSSLPHFRKKNRSKIICSWQAKVGWKINQIRSETFKAPWNAKHTISKGYRAYLSWKVDVCSLMFLIFEILPIPLNNGDWIVSNGLPWIRPFTSAWKKPPFCREKSLTFSFLRPFEKNLHQPSFSSLIFSPQCRFDTQWVK